MYRELWYRLCKSCRPNKSRTVRYAFPLVFLVTVFTSAAAVISSGDTYLKLESNVETVKPGEVFYIDIAAVAASPVNAVDIVVKYPESQMDVIGVDTGQSVITLWTEQPYAEKGKVYLTGGTFRRGFIGEHPIARIRATAKASGMVDVSTEVVSFIAGDGLGTEVEVTDTDTDSTRVYITTTDGKLVGTAEVIIVTDIDGNGVVDFSDIMMFMSAWRTRSTVFDFNDDGNMTFIDFGILLADSFLR